MSTLNKHIDLGDNHILRMPFYVRVRDMDDQETSELLDNIESSMDARYFRTKELLLDVLSDQRAEAAKPLNFDPGPYVVVFIKPGQTRISTSMTVEPGSTVYAKDQIDFFLQRVSDQKKHDQTELSPSATPTPGSP